MFIADILPKFSWILREKVIGIQYGIYCKGKGWRAFVVRLHLNMHTFLWSLHSLRVFKLMYFWWFSNLFTKRTVKKKTDFCIFCNISNLIRGYLQYWFLGYKFLTDLRLFLTEYKWICSCINCTEAKNDWRRVSTIAHVFVCLGFIVLKYLQQCRKYDLWNADIC